MSISKFERVLSDAELISATFKAEVEGTMGELRAVEQAVLQSLEIQELRKDAKRLDWLESCEESHGFYHAGYGDYLYYAHQEGGYPSVREVIDTAMEERSD